MGLPYLLYNQAFLIRVISDYDIWFISRYFAINMNWRIPQNLSLRSLQQYLVCGRTIYHYITIIIIKHSEKMKRYNYHEFKLHCISNYR